MATADTAFLNPAGEAPGPRPKERRGRGRRRRRARRRAAAAAEAEAVRRARGDLPAQHSGLLAQGEVVDAGRPARPLLPRPVAALGPGPGRAGPGALDRHARAACLLLRPRDLAAGDLLPHRPADPRRRRPVLRHRPVRSRLVRLHLPADGVDRPVHVGRAQDRGRPQRPDQAGQGAPVGGEDRQEDRQARRLAADRPGHRRRLDHVFQRRADGGARVLHRPGVDRRLRLRLPVHGDDLPAGRLGPRAGLHLHVPVAAVPGRDVRRGLARRHLRGLARRAPRRRPQGPVVRRPRPLRRLRPVLAGLPHRRRHPQGPADGLHRLRAVRRCLQLGDGPLRPAARADHLRLDRQPGRPRRGRDQDPAAADPPQDHRLRGCCC